MKSMNKQVLKEILSRPQVCARINEGTCKGRITIEHVFGRKYEQTWNCIILCWRHHLIDLNKELNRHIAYQQASLEDLRKYSKAWKDYVQEKKYLEQKYDQR